MRIDVLMNTGTRARDGLADIHFRTEDEQEYQLDLPFDDLYRRCGVPTPGALDLLITASACYTVDKIVPRTAAGDGWTRDLRIHLPVSEPRLWKRVAEDLSQTLGFLTGDIWSLTFYQAPEPLFEAPKKKTLPLPSDSSIKAVCLFSGGLDSLAGAIDLLSDAELQQILLIGHYDGSGPRKAQADLASQLAHEYPNRFAIEHVRVAQRPEKAAENTLRSRSFVFMALGLYGAQGSGPETPLYVFENGLIALNVPLTPSRRGSCSTRTMHPFYLNQLRSVIAALGISNPIINPYGLKTKGECITGCKNQKLLARLADVSVSCSHSSRRQDWVRKNAKNCGYCVPCLCRRAALYKAGLDDGRNYGRDVLAGELEPDDQLESANDLRAVTDFLRSPLNIIALRKKLLAVAPLPDPDAYAQLACRGFTELKTWLSGTAAESSSNIHA